MGKKPIQSQKNNVRAIILTLNRFFQCILSRSRNCIPYLIIPYKNVWNQRKTNKKQDINKPKKGSK